MSREFTAAARQAFLAGFPALAPHYRPQPLGPAPYASPGETAFAWVSTASLTAWVILVPSLKGYNEFTIELGWSRLGRYPELSMRPALPFPTADRAEWARPEYLCRLASLTPSSPEWWGIAPTDPDLDNPAEAVARAQKMTAKLNRADARQQAQPLIAAALEALRAHGLPYLQAWAAAAASEHAPDLPR